MFFLIQICPKGTAFAIQSKPTKGAKKKEVIAEKQKDKEQEDVESVIKRALEESKKKLKNMELDDPDCTLSEEKIAKGEVSSKSKLTKGTKKKNLSLLQEEAILKLLKDYEDYKLLDAEIARNVNQSYTEAVEALTKRYKTWFHTRSHTMTGAKLVLLLREHDRFEEQGLTRSTACLKICAFLRWECRKLAYIIHQMSKQQMSVVYKELVAATTQKDEGWEEQEQVVKEIIEDLMNLEFFCSGYTPLEERVSNGEAAIKTKFGAEKQKDDEKSAIKLVMEQWKKHLKNLEDDACEQEEEQAVEDVIGMLEDCFELHTPLGGEVVKEVEPSMKEDDRWSLEEQVNKLIDDVLDVSFPRLGAVSETFICREDFGDYQCKSVLSVWPKLKEKGKEPEGPKNVGKTIAMELGKRSRMIEGNPCERSFGFVTFKLSGNWIAKSLNRMIKHGIDTWAPKLPFKGVIVEIPDYESSIRNTIVGSEADIIRSSFIRETFIRMLEYSKVFVKCSKDDFLKDALSHVPDDIWSFSVEERDGDAVMYSNVEGKMESFNFGKRGIRDVKDCLKILWYELNDKRADWIVSLNPLRQQGFVEMCHTVAKHAGWMPTAKHTLSFAGYQTHAEAGKLVYLLEDALIRCNAIVKQGKSPKYTAERLLCCAIGYEYLRTPRMLDCKFSVDEMLNKQGNTFLHLLNTKSQVLSVLANSGEDIKLKKVSELMVMEDQGRALGFHLLTFTQVLQESCFSVMPHILCRYVHDLSQKFISYDSCSRVYEVGSAEETSRLILCEATALVMEKCFHLLGVTPVSIFGDSLIELLTDLKRRMGPRDHFISCYDSVIASLGRDPPKHIRFEITAICPQLTEFKRGKLFGRILVHDKYGMLSDAWLPTTEPDFGMASLFSREWYNPIEMVNHGLVSMGNPNARHSIPVTASDVKMRVELIVTNEAEDLFYHLPYTAKRYPLQNFRDIKGDGVCGTIVLKGKDMEVLMYGILVKDAVDTDVEVTFRVKDAHRKVEGRMYAYYGKGFPYVEDGVTKSFYVFELLEPSIIKAGPLQLGRSKIPVPKDGSLVIEAKFTDADSGKVLLHGLHEFPSKIRRNSKHSIRGRRTSCSLDLTVNWNYA